MKVGLVYDPIYLQHDTGQHPENARRLEEIVSHLEKTSLMKQLVALKPRAASFEELALVHSMRHIAHVQEVAEKQGGWLDADTFVSPRSYEVARYAAGGAIVATDAVMNGEVSSAFALIRPPGHHATPESAMGFCLFNNIAIAAKCALTRYNLERVAIIDFDVHHGNGTQEAFYAEPRVLYVSTHQYPYYPGTGWVAETGASAAKGTKVNIPLPSGCGDVEYRQVFEQVIAPIVRRYGPQLILVSAGYDPHWADELAMMAVSVSGFAQMASIIKGLAEELCGGRLVFALEGGYNLVALAASVKATFDVLLGNPVEDTIGPAPSRFRAPDITSLVKQLKEIHQLA
ncbi:MAG: histone deacetylase [Chloroflexi bacterium]|nr:histone deacetylase [Chloroflexota bacterium]